MSMGSNSGAGIPVRTLEVARASNPGAPRRCGFGTAFELFTDEDFADWYPSDGRRGISPVRPALVSVLQFAENLTDRQAAESVRCRVDWKYALGLELDDPGFDHLVLSEFRNRVAEGDRADRLLAVFVERLVAAGLVRARRTPRRGCGPCHRCRPCGRFGCSSSGTTQPAGCVGEARRTRRTGPVAGTGLAGPRPSRPPTAHPTRHRRRCPGRRWHSSRRTIARPRFCHNAGKAAWVGYRVHLTETCDTGGPKVIVHVATAPAPEQDIEALDGIHAALVACRLAPHEHLVDAGYVSAETIRYAAATHGIDLTGPVRVDPHAAERPGFAKEDFTLDWDNRTATCPRGITSSPWKPNPRGSTAAPLRPVPQSRLPGLRRPPPVHRQHRRPWATSDPDAPAAARDPVPSPP